MSTPNTYLFWFERNCWVLNKKTQGSFLAPQVSSKDCRVLNMKTQSVTRLPTASTSLDPRVNLYFLSYKRDRWWMRITLANTSLCPFLSPRIGWIDKGSEYGAEIGAKFTNLELEKKINRTLNKISQHNIERMAKPLHLQGVGTNFIRTGLVIEPVEPKMWTKLKTRSKPRKNQ